MTHQSFSRAAAGALQCCLKLAPTGRAGWLAALRPALGPSRAALREALGPSRAALRQALRASRAAPPRLLLTEHAMGGGRPSAAPPLPRVWLAAAWL